MRFLRQLSLALLLAGILLTASALIVSASDVTQAASTGEQIFKSKCTACHTIGGGKLVGPDLKDVPQRRSAQWLTDFITDPQKMISAGDPDAAQLLKDFNGVMMPTLGLSTAEVEAVLSYLQNPAASAGAGAPVVMGDPQRGEKLFRGAISLANGGAACNACHTVAGVGFLGGGALGPDLTKVLTRYGGAAGMAAALSTLPFPTMQGIFAARPLSPAEQADLLAFFAQADASGQTSFPLTIWLLLAVGIAGASGLFGLMYRYWPKQSESLSEKLRRTETV